MSEDRVGITIPRDLYDALMKSMDGKSFKKVDDYVTYVLRVAFGKTEVEESMSDEDSQKVEERLKALGYI